MQEWFDHFPRNRAARPVIDFGSGIDVPEPLRTALIRSLQRFEVGESGDGAHLKRGAARVSPLYLETITLFISEENDHAGWLARLIEGMGGKRLTWHWSDALFVALRRLCGLHVELFVLLVAEMIAIRYYRALNEGSTDPICRAVFGQICRDEDGHVAFHIAFLRQEFARRSAFVRWLVRASWRVLYRGACLVVNLDHRPVLRECGVSMGEFWLDTGEIFDSIAGAIFATPYVVSPSSHQPLVAARESNPEKATS